MKAAFSTPTGFFDTGDVATIDADGYMQITDRSKDVIKSGGEWISSIAIENAAIGSPGGRRSRGDRRAASEVAGATAC
jgi:acyl-CoA synthetase (AMP-forming)/AMP-acid ligase II